MRRNLWIWGFVFLAGVKMARSLARRVWRKLGGRRPGDPAAALPREIPRIVWIYWDDGEAAAVVEAHSERNAISVQAYSDLLRLRLLERHGGVWADATVYCLQPLDGWLPPLARHGFFTFVWTDADSWFLWPNMRRLITSWFLACEPAHPVVAEWASRSFADWRGRTRPHDYYWVHLIFEDLVLTDGAVRREWRRMPKLGAVGPHLVHEYVRGGRDRERVRAALRSGAVPVQKLRWNWPDADLARAREVLDDLPPSPVARAV